MLFGLIGFPLDHSFSKIYFENKFQKEGLKDHSYLNFEISEISDFTSIVENNPDLIGLNVTIPHKEAVIPFLNELDETAQKVGAVNVVNISNLKGYNSDLFGFKRSMEGMLFDKNIKALILGTGGASKAVKVALEELEIPFHMVSSSLKENSIPYSRANEILGEHKLVINTTPLGMSPNIKSFPDLEYSKIGSEHLLFDLVYNPEMTKFLQLGQENGARIKNGLEMLRLQAEKSWEIWNE